MPVQIQLRRGTASQWTSFNPILAAGEIGTELDTGKFKVGDGVTAWNSLGYAISPTAYNLVNTQAGTSYTFALGDDLKLTSFTSSSAITATVPTNASVPFTIGSRLDILQKGIGQVTIAPAVGATINAPTTLRSRDQYSIISVIKVDTNEWVATGDLAVV